MSVSQRTGGQAIVEALLSHDVEVLFGLPGIQNDWLYNALFDARDRIRVIHTRHEQGAAYLALGWALARGDVAVYNVVPGPGFLNSTAALATAYALGARVLCLTGQIPSDAIGRQRGVLHELPDQLGILCSLTKWAARINAPSEAQALVDEAFRQLGSGRPRPVGLEVPMDVLAREEPVATAPPRLALEAPTVDLDLLEKAARLLGKSQHPLIYVGGGAVSASHQIRHLAEALEAPVVGYRTGRGVLDSRHYLSVVLPESHALWREADVVLAIGTNLRVPLESWGIDDQLKIIRIDVDPAAHDRIHAPSIALTARAEDALPLLLERLARYNRLRPSRRDEMMGLHAAFRKQSAFLQPQLAYLEVIRQELGEDGIFVDELTQVGFAARVLLPVYHPRTFISTGYQGTLGYGFPTALGVKVARPAVPVVSVTGDGGFLFAVAELATAVQHRIGLVTIVFNNNCYGNVQQMQKNIYGNRVIASDLVNPDFRKLAEAFGAAGYRAETLSQLRKALQSGFRSDLPTVIEVPCGDMPDVDRFRKLPRVRHPS